MSSYKVLQDIEAEDKLVGPLTLRQFIYGLVGIFFFYLTFLAITKGAPYLSIVFAPFGMISGFFAWPWGKDQPTEVWALAKIRFLFKPRKRIWNQSGTKELVTITAPKHVEINYTNGLSQDEVQSRLKALANTIDSRGWAIKNVNVNLYSQPSALADIENSDRLVNPTSFPQAVPSDDITASDDMLDETNNPVARQFETMIEQSSRNRRQALLNRMRQSEPAAPMLPTPAMQSQPATPPAPTSYAPGTSNPSATAQTPQSPAPNYWFLNQPTPAAPSAPPGSVTFNTQVVTPGAATMQLPTTMPKASAKVTPEEEAVIRELETQEHNQTQAYNHFHTIQPLSVQQAQAKVQAAQAAAAEAATQAAAAQRAKMTQAPDAAILQLATNDDLNVATLAREAHKRQQAQDEVVISLH